MNLNRYFILAALCCSTLTVKAQRTVHLLNDNWTFRLKGTEQLVSLPHTWNAQDALAGKLDYYRGIGNYERILYIDPTWRGKRLFLRFEGVNSVADVFINGKYVGEHRGGYSAFIYEITDRVAYGKNNTLLVRVSNAERLDVMPLVGDFNFYGGIYRDVTLLITNPVCISPLDYASPGVYLTQRKVSRKSAEVTASVCLSNRSSLTRVTLRIEVKDGDHTVCRTEQPVNLKSKTCVDLPLSISKPRLWNGREDPFIYRAEVTLWDDERLLDKVVQPLGLRYYEVDPDKGFFLNGRHLYLQGVCRHQDRPEIGNALRSSHHAEDLRIMLDMGVNAVRLAHYQQAEEMYRLMDEAGIITWAEIPFVGSGGKGFVDSPAFRENGKEQLRELIRQNYNHPSICFWGIFNELNEVGDNLVSYVRELNVLAHAEDSTRFTTSASYQQGELNFITDCIAWNRYYGWYYGKPHTLAQFLDRMHSQHPQLRIAISEYGAGASIYHQQDSLKQPAPAGYWHPENWQTYYHMENWRILHERPFVWGSFVWNMFDFGSAHRREGDRPGINDKGLVTFDRSICKDAYYFYKANWNPSPMLHLCGKRYIRRTASRQDFIAFCNAGKVELFVNGESVGEAVPDSYAIIRWQSVPLRSGENHIRVQGLSNKDLSDELTIFIIK